MLIVRCRDCGRDIEVQHDIHFTAAQESLSPAEFLTTLYIESNGQNLMRHCRSGSDVTICLFGGSIFGLLL